MGKDGYHNFLNFVPFYNHYIPVMVQIVTLDMMEKKRILSHIHKLTPFATLIHLYRSSP